MSQQGKLFQTVDLKLLLDPQVTRQAVLDHLDSLTDRVSADDLLLLHLGGHGISRHLLAEIEVDGKRWVSDANLESVGRFLFCCPDLSAGNLRGTTISFEDLYDKLVKLPCHKLILIDACHAGEAQTAVTGDESPIRILTKDGIGPVILAACAQNESAIEANTIIDIDLNPAYGFFSIALRRLLRDEATFEDADRAPRDGKLGAAEVADAVRNEVRKMVSVFGVRDRQNPSAFLPALEAPLPLMRWNETKK